jgi:hypothetical protein
MRLRHALPAGLLDAGFASLARLAIGIYAARALTVSDLGAYALFFSAFVFASVVPMQFVLVPAELASLGAARPERLALLRQSWRIGMPVSVATALVVNEAAELGVHALTMTACAALTPLQEHVRRVLHLAGISWHAAAVSLVQLGCVALALLLLARVQVPAIWRPFGALTIGTVVSLGAGCC